MKEQSAPEVAWATIYQGLDTATTLSGLNNGIYEVRLQTGPESWSPPLEIAIKHHSLTKAYSFFALGLVLFIFLLGLLLCAPKSAIPPSVVNSKRI